MLSIILKLGLIFGTTFFNILQNLKINDDDIGEIVFLVGDPGRVPEISKYFEKITLQKEYYPTRKEKEILKKLSKKIPLLFKGNLSFVEIGSGAADKIKILSSIEMFFNLNLFSNIPIYLKFFL